jgi:uncharacterized OB-fold protein
VIGYQRCRACAAVWYFRRAFCPRCGSRSAEGLVASGRGTVAAATTVHRAPTPELRDAVPYRLVLVDAVEGFRLMAHAELAAQIGDPVQARAVEFGGRPIPFFVRGA